jgi:hypothetical protein
LDKTSETARKIPECIRKQSRRASRTRQPTSCSKGDAQQHIGRSWLIFHCLTFTALCTL